MAFSMTIMMSCEQNDDDSIQRDTMYDTIHVYQIDKFDTVQVAVFDTVEIAIEPNVHKLYCYQLYDFMKKQTDKKNIHKIIILDETPNFDSVGMSLSTFNDVDVDLNLSNCTGIQSLDTAWLKYPQKQQSNYNYHNIFYPNIRHIELPNTLTKIGYGAFADFRLLKEITIPNSVTSIGSDAFYGCSSLTEITIPNSVTSIVWGTFSGCSSLKEITIPNSVTSIGNYAFRDCSSLKEITIPNSVTSIGYEAFRDCSSLKEITIPNSVTSIGEYAFYYCSSLTEITIPNSVMSIGDDAFYHCHKLISITLKSEKPPKMYYLGYYVKIYVPSSAVETYKTAEGWKQYADNIFGY